MQCAAALPLYGLEPLQKIRDPKALHDYHGPEEEKAVFVKKADVADDRFGKTPGCPGCVAVKNTVKCSVAHNDVCRQRVYERLCDDSDARVHKLLKECPVA